MTDDSVRRALMAAQKNEITEHHVYRRLAESARSETNRHAFASLAGEEHAHYERLKALTGEDVAPSRMRARLYFWLARLFGFNFGARMMERGEESAQRAYRSLRGSYPELDSIIRDEEHHEEVLLGLIDQRALQYSGSVVLGLTDALVELLGVLAGLTLALQNTHLVALVGVITGIAASLSMAGSEYLSTKEEGRRHPLQASIYTGVSYVLAVALLILPYLILGNALVCLAVSVGVALLIMFTFTYYVAVVKNLSVGRRFAEMAGIGLGVALINFAIGLLVRRYFHVDI